MASLSHTVIQLTFLSLVFLVPIAIFIRRLTKAEPGRPRLPPGPRQLPIIGNLHQVAMAGRLPHYSLRELARKHGPVIHLRLGEISAVVISSAEGAREVLQTHDLAVAQRPHTLAMEVISRDHPGVIASPYGQYWRWMRRVCVVELLGAKRVASFRAIREEETQAMVDSVRLGQSLNLSRLLFEMTNSVVCRAAFGAKCQAQEDFVSTMNELVKYGTGFGLADLFPSLRFLGSVTGMRSALLRLFGRLDKTLGEIIDDHLAAGEPQHEDLVDVLLRLKASDELKFEIGTKHIKGVILDIFAAGGETGAATMEWAMAELLRNPGVMKKAQDEARLVLRGKTVINEEHIHGLDYLKLVVKETLRLHPPAPVSAREARESFQVFGYDVPNKAKVIINLWAIGRDPSHWDDAESFVPERFLGSSLDFTGFDFEYIPFGAGRRICPGILFGISNIELALAKLLYHFDWKLADGKKPHEIDFSEVISATSRIKNNLILIATPFVPLLGSDAD